MRCRARDGGRPLRSRLAGGGFKPPSAASVKSRGGERGGKGAPRARQVGVKKTSESEPFDDASKAYRRQQNRGESLSRDQPGGYLLTDRVECPRFGGHVTVRPLLSFLGV